MTHLKKVLALPSDREINEFVEMLEAYVGDTGHTGKDIAKFLKTHPDLAKRLDVGDLAKPLYRGMGLNHKAMAAFHSSGTLKYSYKDVMSWTSDKAIAVSFSNEHGLQGVFKFVLSKKIPRELRMVDMAAYGIHEHESEILCWPQDIKKEDVEIIRFVDAENSGTGWDESSEKINFVEINWDQIPDYLERAKAICPHKK